VSPDDLLEQLRAAGSALDAARAEAEQLRQRVRQLEAICRLNAETIRGMKRAAIEAMAAAYRRAPPQR
jgi:hypothetical protein